MRHSLSLLVAALLATPALAQQPASTAAQAAKQQPAPPAAATAAGSDTRISGSVTAGALLVDDNTNSAKFTEYRDLKDSFALPGVNFSLFKPGSGFGVDASAVNLLRDDRTILAKAGQPGVWAIQADWKGTPHNFSNKAVTPYTNRGGGLFTVPATVPITFKKLATSAPDTPNVLASDDLIAAYQATYLAPTELATQTNTGHFALAWSSSALSLGASYDLQDKQGSKSGFGPIGDRPPRTLNIQLAEPVDYQTNDLTLSAEHQGRSYQVRADYLYSDFANAIDTLKWQNAYTTAAPGADYDVWDRLVSVYGQRPLPPDNQYHNLTVNGGVNMAHDSRLSATFAYGQFDQDATLLPYAYGDSALQNRTLPRASAAASMNTTHVAADYVIAPVRGTTFRAFFRQYTLNNDTPSSNWQYVTQDTYNTNGTVNYVNKRVSLPVAWARQNFGAEAIFRLAKRNTLTVAFEREGRDRDHREADTDENIFRAVWRVKPAAWASVEARYLYGGRTGTEYHNTVTHEGYWYTAADSPDNNNPAVTFDNHPDTRRHDVIDRARQQFDVRVNLTPEDAFALSAYVRYRSDDFDSGVGPSKPLAGTGLAEQEAVSPGNQLGLLEDARLRYGLDFFYQPTPRVTLTAFLNFDEGTSQMKSLEFNENNKQNPSAVNTAELGPWTRGSSQWTADTTDRTWGGGLGASFQLAENGSALFADYTASLADVDIAYGGFGTTNWDGTPFPPNHQFYFATPPTVREDLHVFNLRFEIPVKMMTLIVGYGFESYTLDDWQQGSTAPWVERVGADTLLRDTSRSFQWGNRLFNLGTYLSPSYDAHIGFVGLRYKF
jgi:MtrB/PioB family decaheme-associated outer membrane protein